MVEVISDSNYQDKLSKGNAVVDFYADWCGPCQLMKPVFDKLSKDFKEVKFYKIDVDDSQSAAAEFGVRSIPTIVFFKDGEEVDRFMGFAGEEPFKAKLKQVFGK